VVDPSFLQSVNVSILPRSDSTYDLGSSSYRWKNGYFAGTIYSNIIRILGSFKTYGSLENLLPALPFMWNNSLAFKTPYKVEIYDPDTGTWTDWIDAPDFSILTNLRGNNIAFKTILDNLGRDEIEFRLYYAIVDTWHTNLFVMWVGHFTRIDYLKIDASSYSDFSSNVRVCVELPSGVGSILDGAIYVPMQVPAGRKYVRIHLKFSRDPGSTWEMWLKQIAIIGLLLWGEGFDTTFPISWTFNSSTKNIVPKSDNVWDLGSSSLKWKDGYFGGFLDIGSLQIGGTEVIDASRILKNITSIAQDLLPNADNAYNLGLSSLRWKNVYFSGIISLRGSAIEGALQIAKGGRWLGLGTRNANFDWLIGDDSEENFEISLYDVTTSTYNWGVFEITSDLNATVIKTTNLKIYNIIPLADNSYDLGSASLRFKDGYFAGLLDIGSLQISGTEVIDSSRILKNIASIAQTLLPDADNSYDLGSSSYRWKNAYFAGSIQLGDGTNKEILRIKGEREWALLQTGSGANTDLRLKTLAGDKYFRLVDASDNIIAEWFLGTTDPHMALNGRLNVSGILLPSTDNTYDIGSASFRWRNAYFANYLKAKIPFSIPRYFKRVKHTIDYNYWNITDGSGLFGVPIGASVIGKTSSYTLTGEDGSYDIYELTKTFDVVHYTIDGDYPLSGDVEVVDTNGNRIYHENEPISTTDFYVRNGLIEVRFTKENSKYLFNRLYFYDPDLGDYRVAHSDINVQFTYNGTTYKSYQAPYTNFNIYPVKITPDEVVVRADETNSGIYFLIKIRRGLPYFTVELYKDGKNVTEWGHWIYDRVRFAMYSNTSSLADPRDWLYEGGATLTQNADIGFLRFGPKSSASGGERRRHLTGSEYNVYLIYGYNVLWKANNGNWNNNLVSENRDVEKFYFGAVSFPTKNVWKDAINMTKGTGTAQLWSDPSTPGDITIVSDDSGDTTSFYIVAYDSSGNIFYKGGSLNGTTPVTVSGDFAKILYVDFETAPSGNITIKDSGGNTLGTISAGIDHEINGVLLDAQGEYVEDIKVVGTDIPYGVYKLAVFVISGSSATGEVTVEVEDVGVGTITSQTFDVSAGLNKLVLEVDLNTTTVTNANKQIKIKVSKASTATNTVRVTTYVLSPYKKNSDTPSSYIFPYDLSHSFVHNVVIGEPISGYLETDLIPTSDGQFDFGSSSYRWKDGYFAGAVDLGSLKVDGTEVITSGRVLQNVTADASIITSGVLDLDRIPNIDWSRISGNFPRDIGDLISSAFSRSWISDFFSSPFWDNIPDKPSSFPPELHASTHALGGSDELSLDASQITSGTLSVDRIPNLDASKITSGVFDVARIPDLTRSKITDFFDSPFWDNIPDKPSTFPPSSHTHARSDITDFFDSPFWSNIPDKPFEGLGSEFTVDGSDNLIVNSINFSKIASRLSSLLTFDSSLIPNADNTYDLGSSSYRWKDGYFAGKLSSGQIYFSPTIEDKISLYDNRLGQTDMYGFGVAANTLYFKTSGIADKGYEWYSGANYDGTSWLMKLTHDGYLKLAGHFIPKSDNTYDLGSSSLRWKNSYFAGTVDAGGFSVSGVALSLKHLADVDSALSPSTGDVLTYDGTKWTAGEGGGGAGHYAPYVGDETELSTTSTSYTVMKEFNFTYLSTADITPSTMIVVVEAYNDTSGQTTTIGVYIDGSLKREISFTETSYTVKSASIDLSALSLSDGAHNVQIKMKVTGGTGYIRLTEVWMR